MQQFFGPLDGEFHTGGRASVRRISALLIAILGFSAPAFAAEDPATVARALYATYADGDVASFKRLWAESVTPVHLADITTEQRVKCITLIMFRAEEPRIDAGRAEVDVVAVLSRTSRINGRTTVDIEHAMIGMKREHDEWHIDRWLLKEDELVDRIVAAKSIDEARSLVRENVELLDSAFYRGLRRKSTTLINQRLFDAEEQLTAAMGELAAMAADDGILSTTDVLESITERVGPKPDTARALAGAEEALVVAERFGDPDVLGSALLNLVRAYQWRDGNSTGIAPLLERVLSARAGIEDQGLVVRAAVLMAAVHQEHGDYRACFPYLQIAQEIATRLNNALYLCDVESMQGEIYAAENDFELAAMHFGRARAFADSLHFQLGYVGATQMMARCNLRLGRTSEFQAAAGEVLKRAASAPDGALRDFAAQTLTDIAIERLRHGDLVQAETAIQKALTDAEKGVEDESLGQAFETLARVRLTQRRYDDAIRAAEQSIGVRSKQKTVARLTPWLLEARAHLALGNRTAAYAALRSAVDYGEQERAGLAGSERQLELSFEPAAAAYVMLVDLLVEDRRYDEAFLVAEKAKARALLDVLSSERSSAELEVPEAQIAAEQKLEQKLVEANRNAATKPAGATDVEKARLELESYRAALDARYPPLHAARGAGYLTAVSSLAPLLSARTALVEYVVSPHNVHLFIAQAGDRPRLTVRTVPIEQAALKRLIDQFSTQLASRDAAYRPAARQLYNVLLKPAVEVAGQANLFSIVPDDALWRVPFETLLDGHGRFAVERRAFHYAPSAAVLLSERSHHEANVPAAAGHAFLGFGNPRLAAAQQTDHAGRGASLGAIPEAADEVRAIGRLFGPGQSIVYVGAEALESRVKAEAPVCRIIHFATHGVLDDANPMYSHLLLARREGDREDGVLEAREMMKMHLSADLVVLSACDTARGGVHAGEGLIGMTWALFAAGCPAVVASEWRVGSATTEVLMVSFYRKWLRARAAGHPLTKAEALRQARLALLRDPRYHHPYYWSPFVLIGAAE
ncbi:MAG TPA: CHAT domain-containing protein [Thermoanaerobaculia bacterium]